jgi:hypothetical protein
MDRKPVSLRFDEPEALIYDCGGDGDKRALAKSFDARAREIIDAGSVSSVTVYHPAGFVAWYYEDPKPAFGWYR